MSSEPHDLQAWQPNSCTLLHAGCCMCHDTSSHHGALCLIQLPLSYRPISKLISGCLPQDWQGLILPQCSRRVINIILEIIAQWVSCTCLVVKVLERLIHRQVVRFLNDNDKINASQHGFRKAHSCQTQLLETIHQWAENLDHSCCIFRFCKSFWLSPTWETASEVRPHGCQRWTVQMDESIPIQSATKGSV